MSNFVDTTEENTRFVIKRNGEKVSFELSKMKSAITKAMKSIDKVFIEIQIISLM
jgi:transcriptional regulator NrdR family protein